MDWHTEEENSEIVEEPSEEEVKEEEPPIEAKETPEAEFEGVDDIENIPKGKEKDYGI